MASRNSALSEALRQSLQETLTDVSLDNWGAVTPQRNFALMQQRNEPVMPSNAGGAFGLGLLSSDRTKASRLAFCASSASSAGNPLSHLRKVPAFGMRTDELLIAAAAEKRMLSHALQQKVLMESHLQRQRYNQSLLSLFSKGSDMMGVQFPGQKGFLKQIPSESKEVLTPPKDPKATLEVLGSSLRKKDSPYLDVSVLPDTEVQDTTSRKTRGGVTEPFPEKLHRMLDEVEEAGNSDIVSFYSHGRAFGVHDPERFVSEIMPKYFKQSRLSSFQRQLNLYGFTRITAGSDAGGYYHELFLKGRPSLAVHMRRVGVPQGEDRRKLRTMNKHSEPNFYSMAPAANSSKQS